MHLIYQSILDWHAEHGRTHLPWQADRDAYRIWVSEIMLQQTQVNTVIPYYERFMHRFATVSDLANSKIDEVLHLWTGLGYYARARNMHQAAKVIEKDHAGNVPTRFDDLLALPGIGRSTAGAILALSQEQQYAILDGNVKRVLARFYQVEGWPGRKAVEAQLWTLAEQNTPSKEVARYTQAIMDFGATLCTRSQPQCGACPLSAHCQAYQNGRVAEFPHTKARLAKPTRQTFMLLIRDRKRAYLLEQRPPSGIWGGLWCPPQSDFVDREMQISNFNLRTTEVRETIKHSFSHFNLEITPVETRILNQLDQVTENPNQVWYSPTSKQRLGLAAPIKKLLEKYH